MKLYLWGIVHANTNNSLNLYTVMCTTHGFSLVSLLTSARIAGDAHLHSLAESEESLSVLPSFLFTLHVT